MLASPKINVQTKLILFKRAKFRCLHIDKNLTIDGIFEFLKNYFFQIETSQVLRGLSVKITVD